MGCVESRPPDLGESNPHTALEYRSGVNIVIKRRDALGRVIESLPLRLKLLAPTLLDSFSVVLAKNTISGSCCLLPGQSGAGQDGQISTDSVKIEGNEESLFACLCEGHGPDAAKVAAFCQLYATDYYRSHVFEFRHDPSMNFTILCELCHNALKGDKEIDSERSGASVILVYMNDQGFCVGNLGVSKAVLAYMPREILPMPQHRHNHNQYSREITPNKVLGLAQLTITQRPDNKDELRRITKAGGVVEKAKDARGVRAGAYCLWKSGCDYPGLTLTRAIGYSIGEDCGVIATPIVQSYKAHLTDQFIILGNSGLWTVMENREAVDFVERYRQGAQKRSAIGKGLPKSGNTTIAHLLCEEARYRWLGLAEEGMNIEPVTCIILELNSEEPVLERIGPESPRERPVLPFDNEEEKETEELNVKDLTEGLTPLRDMAGASHSDTLDPSLN